QMLGGGITMRSTAGVGTCFTLRLPADPEAAPGPAAGDAAAATEAAAVVAQPSEAQADPVILIIDDEPGACEMISRMLAREGLRTVSANDGETGLRLARELRPALILLDVLMPSVDGWAVLSRLKADPELAGIPVIMVSVAGDQAMGVALGASDYLVKPVDRESLARALDKHLRHAGERRVLVVEDDATTRSMLRKLLERQGWEVSEAGNGREGLDRVREARP